MKRILVSLAVLTITAAVVLSGTIEYGQAFTGGSISVSGDQWSASFIPSGNDGGSGADYFCVVCYNADGTLDDIDIRNKPTSSDPTSASGPCNSAWGPRTLPLSVQLRDPQTRPTGISEDSPSAAAYCGVQWNPPGGDTRPPADGGDNDGGGGGNTGGGAVGGPAGRRVAVPGCDITIGAPEGAVGGTFLVDTEVYWMPDVTALTEITLEGGKNVKVTGMDESGSFYQIVWNCSILWVPVGTIGPTYDAVWGGAPLPTAVVG